MKIFICLCLFAVAVNAQFYIPPQSIIPIGFPYIPYPVGFPYSDEYAASLGGAQVGLYGKTHGPYGLGFPGYFGYPYGSSDVTGASLGGAKVGIFGKERPGSY